MKQPKALYLLSCIQMWKFFSHYGMRALLVLYMVDALRMSDARAFGINAVFCSIVELGGIFGGILADRVLGLRRACMLGAVLIATGYLSLLFLPDIYFSLPIIVLGASLFSSNITALLGEVYAENDSCRKKGFTYFYMMQNLGALVSTFLCGVIAQKYGFKAGFAFAAIGMVFGNLMLFLGRPLLKGLGTPPPQNKRSFGWIGILLLIFAMASLTIAFSPIALPILPWVTVGIFIFFAMRLFKCRELPKERVRLLLIYLVGLILFFALQDQICSSLIVFSNRMVDRTILGWTLPSSILMSINPIVILLLGSLIAKMRFRLAFPFALSAVSFGCLALLCFWQIAISFSGVMGTVVMISVAELMVGPIVMSYASKIAPKRYAGVVMGMIPIAFSIAFLLSGSFSQMVAIDGRSDALVSYGVGFGKIALIALVGGIILDRLIKKLRLIVD